MTQQPENKVEFIVESESRNAFGLYFILALSLLAFSIPIIALVFAIYFPELKIGLSFIITIAIFGGSGYFLLRMFLWNKYGSENYEVFEQNIKYWYDYKLFKSQVYEQDFRKITLNFYTDAGIEVPINESLSKIENDSFYIGFDIDDTHLRSKISASRNRVKDIQNQWLQNFKQQSS